MILERMKILWISMNLEENFHFENIFLQIEKIKTIIQRILLFSLKNIILISVCIPQFVANNSQTQWLRQQKQNPLRVDQING